MGILQIGIFKKIKKNVNIANGHIPKYAHVDLLSKKNKLTQCGNTKEDVLTIIRNPKCEVHS